MRCGNAMPGSSWSSRIADIADLRGRDAALWLQRFEDEHDNFRSVLAYLLESGDSASALRLAGALSRFWMSRGHLREGRRWLETTLEASAGADDARARALRGLALIAMEQGDLDRAAAAAEEALPARSREWRRGGSCSSRCACLRTSPPTEGISTARPACGRSRAELCAASGTATGACDRRSITSAHVARLQGELAQRGDVLRRVARDLPRTRRTSEGQAWDAYRPGADRTRARRPRTCPVDADDRDASSTRASASWRASSTRSSSTRRCSSGWESPRRRRGCGVRAKRWAARSAARPTIHSSSPRTMRRSLACALALGDEAFERAWELGSAMTLDEAVAFALEQRSSARDPTESVNDLVPG